jgi:hypothetical protein
MAWNASGEEFDRRKHGNALIIGAITGLAAGAAAAVINPNATTGAFILQLVGIFVGTIGIDRLRSDASASAGLRGLTKLKEGDTGTALTDKDKGDKPPAL